MNETIRTLMNHRSIRAYEDKPLTEDEIQQIIRSAQAAPTSSNVQAYSIIGIRNPESKARLAELAGNQPYVARNGHLLVFCLDLHRLLLACELESLTEADIAPFLESTEAFMVGVIDATLAAQNAVIAAESMGLGTVYIGGLRNRLQEVCTLLHTPDRVIPLFALCIGYPSDPSATKPRLPLSSVYHEEQYGSDRGHALEGLQTYNQEMTAYYGGRAAGNRISNWTAGIARQLQAPKRLYIKEFLRTKKLPLQ